MGDIEIIDSKDNVDSLRFYSIPGGHQIELFMNNNNVWSPYSAPNLFSALEKQGLLNIFQEADVLDIGSGTGILGIAAKKLGANRVDLVDNNIEAVALSQVNARLNGLAQGIDFRAIPSDVYDEIPVGTKYDVIIGNLPMNPTIPGVSIVNPAYRSNQNSDDLGREVLDEVISNAREYLNPGGSLIVTASSRQNFEITRIKMRRSFGEENSGWRVLNGSGDNDALPGEHQPLSPNWQYYEPFINHWQTLSSLYHTFTVYRLDQNGNPIHQIFLKDKIIRLAVDPYSPTREIVLYVRNGDNRTKGFRLGDEMPKYDPSIQTKGVDLRDLSSLSNEIFHNYIVLQANV